jgi:hypothetical protein
MHINIKERKRMKERNACKRSHVSAYIYIFKFDGESLSFQKIGL